MARVRHRVRVSSKGQIVLPADLRRELGIESGRALRVRRAGRDIILSLADEHSDVRAMLTVTRAWAKRSRNDPIAELHERRRRERVRERRRG